MICPIRAGAASGLLTLLETIDFDVRSKSYQHIRFTDLTTTHFCRFVVLPADGDLPASLAFSSNHDGDLEAHLDELIAVGRQSLLAIYGHCEGFPAPADDPAVKAYLRRHMLEAACFYMGHRNYSRPIVENDIRVRAAIERCLEEERAKPTWPLSPSGLRAAVQRALAADLSLTTAGFDRRLPRWTEVLPWAVPLALGALVFWPVTIPLLAGAAALLRWKETRDPADLLQTNFPIAHLQAAEDLEVQNQLTHLVRIKPGWFRLLAVRGVLFSIHLLARYVYTQGNLGGIPSIHFARWVIIDGGNGRKRLLFFSNYDLSWESYLGDFIDKAATGLTAVWSNTEGFPKARWLLFGGATSAELFKQWTRRHQLPTQVWYSAYPAVTVPNVVNNYVVREGVRGTLSEADALAWLQRL